MSKTNILIVGGGIAGPTAAHFLTQSPDISVTILERSPSPRTHGQNVDIRGAGFKVVHDMGIEQQVRARHTTEEGVRWVDEDNNTIIGFAADHSEGGSSFTADLEITRSALASILYEKMKERCKWMFGDYVIDIEDQGKDGVRVILKSGKVEHYDLVVAADGLGSRTRGLAFPEVSKGECVVPTGLYMAFCTIPKGGNDSSWRRWYATTRRRGIMTRPDDEGNTRLILGSMAADPRLEQVLSQGVSAQKKLMHDLFDDAGWETGRLLKDMDGSSDFYMDKVARVMLSSWHRGRIVLLGDAAWCASPISGMGTTLGMMGGQILANEIIKHNDAKDWGSAFRSYDSQMRPHVDKAQKLKPGIPGLVYPDSWLSVLILRLVFRFIGWLKVAAKMQQIMAPQPEKMKKKET